MQQKKQSAACLFLASALGLLSPAGAVAGQIMPTSASASTLISYDFGIYMSMTVPANVRVPLPVALVNTGTERLDFHCSAALGCTGEGIGSRGVAAAPGEGLNALNIEFPTALQQSLGVSLAPGERFDFTFATILFDPSEPLGNPSGTVLHPRFELYWAGNTVIARTDFTTISVGAETRFSDWRFFASQSRDPVPEPASLLLLTTGLAGVAAWRRSRRSIGS